MSVARVESAGASGGSIFAKSEDGAAGPIRREFPLSGRSTADRDLAFYDHRLSSLYRGGSLSIQA